MAPDSERADHLLGRRSAAGVGKTSIAENIRGKGAVTVKRRVSELGGVRASPGSLTPPLDRGVRTPDADS